MLGLPPVFSQTWETFLLPSAPLASLKYSVAQTGVPSPGSPAVVGLKQRSMLRSSSLAALAALRISYLGWRFSRNMRPIFIPTVFREGLIAIAITPSIWGHGAILAAIVLAFVLQGWERLAGIVPILVVRAVAIPLLTVRARKQNLNRHVSR